MEADGGAAGLAFTNKQIQITAVTATTDYVLVAVFLIPDSAVEMNIGMESRGRAWRSEGIEANSFNAVYGAWSWNGTFSGVR
jgi:hypothetical protein